MMPRSRWFCWVAIPCLIVPSVLSTHLSAAAVPPEPPSQSASQHVTATMLRMPLQFEANHGQVDAPVKFLARGKGYTLFLTPTESVMVLQQREATSAKNPRAITDLTALRELAPVKQAVVRMKLEGANQAPAIEGMEKLPGIVNYFIGNNPKKWRTEIPTYAKVQYQEAYPGIDLAYYGNQGRLEYDFIVAPGADPNQIKLAFQGASDIRIADSGDLLITTELGDLQMQQPIVYQLEPDGHKTLVAGRYVLESQSLSRHASYMMNYSVGFQLASYDHTKSVVIDPVLSWATYLGGSGGDIGQAIAVDQDGNAYVTGNTTTSGSGFPGTAGSSIQNTSGGGSGASDAFVTKLNAAGTAILYSTYLGGSGGNDVGLGIAVDQDGNAYVTGNTDTPGFGFPGIAGSSIQSTFGGTFDAFITKINAAGTAILYSTYLGGSDGDVGYGIAVDSTGQAYVTGYTTGPGFPGTAGSPIQSTFGGGFDAFVTKLNATGTAFLYSTYLGGGGTDIAAGIAVDQAGNAYVTGYTDTPGSGFPGTAGSLIQRTYGGGGYDAFVTKLNATGTALLYSTYLGGSYNDTAPGIAVDQAGNAYVTGNTNTPGSGFPGTAGSSIQNISGGGSDAFVTKLNADGTALLYSTYLGGSGSDYSSGIAVDGAGQAYVTGLTDTPRSGFPGTAGSVIQSTYGGGDFDAFVTKLNATGTALLYSTYLGSSGTDYGNKIAVNGAGQVYVTGYTDTPGSGFPGTAGSAIQSMSGGSFDAFVAKINDVPPNQNPVCSAAVANPNSLWQPDGRMVPIAVTGVTDPDGNSVTLTVTTVTQDEPIITKGKKLSPDAVIQAGSASVRAERLDKGNGRVYQISFQADDGKGGSCIGSVKVGVPLNLNKGLIPIDDGQNYSSTTP